MKRQQRVLVAGATGYLGGFIVKEFKSRGFWVRALTRSERKLVPLKQYIDDVFTGEVTEAESLSGICRDIDVVFSSIGITKQKDGLSYTEVDYQGNLNIMNESLKENVSKFMYVSVFNANRLRHLAMVKAKEKFVDNLKAAAIAHVVVRPNGFFSDMAEMFTMARKGRVYLVGDGHFRGNPIHGEDLARACVEHLESVDREVDIGGPEVLTQNQIALQAFDVLGKDPKLAHIPLWVGSALVRLARTFTSVRTYGPLEFFLAVLSTDMVAPAYGQHKLKEFFEEIRSGSGE